MLPILLWFLTFGWAFLTLKLTTTPNLVVAPENLLNTLLMNGAHFGFFGVQAVLIYLSLTKTFGYKTQFFFFSIIFASVFGYYIELRQRTIPGRSYDLFDWLLDTLGAIIFTTIITQHSKKHDH